MGGRRLWWGWVGGRLLHAKGRGRVTGKRDGVGRWVAGLCADRVWQARVVVGGSGSAMRGERRQLKEAWRSAAAGSRLPTVRLSTWCSARTAVRGRWLVSMAGSAAGTTPSTSSDTPHTQPRPLGKRQKPGPTSPRRPLRMREQKRQRLVEAVAVGTTGTDADTNSQQGSSRLLGVQQLRRSAAARGRRCSSQAEIGRALLLRGMERQRWKLPLLCHCSLMRLHQRRPPCWKAPLYNCQAVTVDDARARSSAV